MSVHGPHGHGEIQKPQKPQEVYSRALHELKESVTRAAGDVLDDMPNYRAILQTIKMTKNVSTQPTSRKSGEDLAFQKTLGNKAIVVQSKHWRGTGDAIHDKSGHSQTPHKKHRSR